MSGDTATGLLWLGSYGLVLLICCLLRSKAASLLAIAFGISPAFYLALTLYLGDVGAVRVFAREYRTNLILGPIQIAILLWAAYLAIRLARAKPGSRIDWAGRVGLPGEDEVEWALVVLARAEVHRLLTEVTRKWGREDVDLRRAVAMAGGRPATTSARIRLVLRLLQPRLYRRATARWAARHIHVDRDDRAGE